MPNHICHVCGEKITTWYHSSYKGHPNSVRVLTCSRCIINAAVAKFQSKGILDHVLTGHQELLGSHPEVAIAVSRLESLAIGGLMDLQREIGAELNDLFVDKEGRYECISSNLIHARFENYGGNVSVSFYFHPSLQDDFASLSFTASECNPELAWKLTSFAGSRNTLNWLIDQIWELVDGEHLQFHWILEE